MDTWIQELQNDETLSKSCACKMF